MRMFESLKLRLLLAGVALLMSVLQTRVQASQAMVSESPLYSAITNSTALLYLGNASPSSLVLLVQAVPVVLNPVDNKVLVSTASYGYGRVVAFSHEAMLINNLVLLRNAAVWAADGANGSSAKPGTIGVAYLESGDDVSRGFLPGQVRGLPRTVPVTASGCSWLHGGPTPTSTT
jgi:hypothetical protein